MQDDEPLDPRVPLNIATGCWVGVHYDMPFVGVCIMIALCALDVLRDCGWDLEDLPAGPSSEGSTR